MIDTKEIEKEKFIEEIRARVCITPEELREIDKENNIKLLDLLKYLRRRKVKNDSIPE